MRRTVPGVLVLVLTFVAGCGGGDPADVAAAPQDPAADPVSAATEDPKDDASLTLPATPSATADVGATADATPTADAVGAPTPTAPPTDGLPGGRYVRIDAIALDQPDAGQYMVTFEPFNFVPLIGDGPEDFHVHFFFDTVAPGNAGTNGQPPGDWFLYDGPSPFTGYTVADRPAGAERLCALVADATHAVTQDTGNCVDLP